MPPTEEQLAALERLREHESLTDNLTDAPAKALLNWAEQQILRGVPADSVFAAVRAANRSAAQSDESALAVAQAALEKVETPAQPASTTPEQQHAGAKDVIPSVASSSEVDREQPASRWSRLRRCLRRLTRTRS